MQKFGLQRSAYSELNAIDLEIAKEKATALGRAGKNLRQALELHSRTQSAESLSIVRDALWQLVIQREVAGIVSGNFEWIKAHYELPDEFNGKGFNERLLGGFEVKRSNDH